MTQVPSIAANAQKSITYTQHAEKRMLERGISKAEVTQTIAAPLRKILAQNGREEFQGWIERAGKQQLLRVLVEGNLVILVVTVMATSKFEKIRSITMKIEYDQQADAMYIRLKAGTVVESDEIRPGVVFDFDADGKVLGIEMLDISLRADNPRELAMELVGA